jgi:methylenetetrahydrofolate dehydrogenase (NADP+)/methenyltetrahydrofolate cyclohydrolase
LKSFVWQQLQTFPKWNPKKAYDFSTRNIPKVGFAVSPSNVKTCQILLATHRLCLPSEKLCEANNNLIATPTHSDFPPIHSKQRASQFLIATPNTSIAFACSASDNPKKMVIPSEAPHRMVQGEVEGPAAASIPCAIITLRENPCIARRSTPKHTPMTARILNGNAIRDEIYGELSGEIAALRASGVRPGLAAVLVGDNPASKIYVTSKIAACERLSLAGWNLTPPATVTTSELLRIVDDLNHRDDVDGILVQLPLPPQVDTKKILEAVDTAKDVDGFHPMNVGCLVAGRPNLVACTPLGVMEILRRSNISIEGANAAVLGRSDIVGKPMALLLMHANATITVCHSKTRNLPEVVRRADIVVAAMGRAAMVTPDYIKPGATVIDVGINRVTEAAQAENFFANFPERLVAFRAKGTALVGDVHPDVASIAGALTPVPGGVGPLTIAMLMSNTVKAARLRRGSHAPASAAVVRP